MEVNLTGVQHSVSRGVPGGNAARGPISSSDVRLSLAASLRIGAIVYTLLLLRDAFMDGVIQQLARDILLAMSYKEQGRGNSVVNTLIRVNHRGCQNYGSFEENDPERGGNYEVRRKKCLNSGSTERIRAGCHFNCKILIEWLRSKKFQTRWWSPETGCQFRLSRYLREKLRFLSEANGDLSKHRRGRRRRIALYNIVIVGVLIMLSLMRILSEETVSKDKEDLTLLNDSLVIIPRLFIGHSNDILCSSPVR